MGNASQYFVCVFLGIKLYLYIIMKAAGYFEMCWTLDVILAKYLYWIWFQWEPIDLNFVGLWLEIDGYL